MDSRTGQPETHIMSLKRTPCSMLSLAIVVPRVRGVAVAGAVAGVCKRCRQHRRATVLDGV